MTDQFSGADLACFRGGRMVFAGLSFALRSGGAIQLRGPNGSGKSTLLRLMAGLLAPVAGQVSWHDGAIDEEPERHFLRLHYVGHHDAVKPVLTARENVDFWAKLRGGGADTEMALETLDIGHLADVPGRFLSAGQKRRVAIAPACSPRRRPALAAGRAHRRAGHRLGRALRGRHRERLSAPPAESSLPRPTTELGIADPLRAAQSRYQFHAPEAGDEGAFPEIVRAQTCAWPRAGGMDNAHGA